MYSATTLAADVNQKLMADRASQALLFVRSMDIPKIKTISNLILQEHFSEFEALSKSVEAAFLKDPLYESQYVKLYNSIDSNNPDILAKLDKWVKERPSYISYGARGIYKENRGFDVRGGEYIDRTPPAKIAEMVALHTAANKDLLFAVKSNPQFAGGYEALILIAKASGDIEDGKKILDMATKAIPGTYYVRHAYLDMLRPRWGGSYALMSQYTDTLDQAALLNPRVWSLKAEVPAEIALTAYIGDDNQKAIQYYTKALSYGDRMEFLLRRGEAYMNLRNFELALKDFTRFQKFDKDNLQVNGYIASIKDFYAHNPNAFKKE
jgi:tetratricopeptide (TPR) repeat protein